MKKIILFFVAVLVLLIVGFYVITGGKGTYKVSEGIGYSRTIKESKERKVFIKELDYKIIPDTIRMNRGIRFFIEKGFRYGEYSAKETLPLRETDDYIYQTGREPLAGEIFTGDYLLGSGTTGRFSVMKDTFKQDIITKKPPYDSIYKVGELLLFDKK